MARHVCPIWIGYFLASGLRRLLQNPSKILASHVSANMKVLDVGSAMGFFSLPMAEAVGPRGKVLCVDVQPKMLDVLRKRAAGAGLADRIETHVCANETFGLDGRADEFDFALAFAVVHEVTDPARFFREVHCLLKPEARLLLAEPRGHVTEAAFRRTVAIARENSLAVVDRPEIRGAHAAILTKPVRTETRRVIRF